jgi:hypothetical protein
MESEDRDMTALIPTGRYSLILPGPPELPVFVRLTRTTSPRRWTTIEVASRAEPEQWSEVHDPATRQGVAHSLQQMDLATASALYTAQTGRCGVCGQRASSDHDRCLARKFGELESGADGIGTTRLGRHGRTVPR